MNTRVTSPPINIYWPRIRRTLVVMLIVAVPIVPPLMFPGLRSVYAPVYDSVILWMIGNVWHRLFPYSMVLLLPVGLLLVCFWITWILRTRYMNRFHLLFTTIYIHLFPTGGFYRTLKTLQAYWIYGVSTLPESYRRMFLFRYTPLQYDISSISRYYLTVASGMVTQWTNAHWREPDSETVSQLKHRIVKIQVGLSGLWVPAIRCVAVIDKHNIARAITHLDNAQLFSSYHWHAIQELFRVYTRKHGMDTDRLGLHRMKVMLEQEVSLDKTILLRMLINLWFENRNPAITAIVIGYTSSYLTRVHRLFHYILDASAEDIGVIETVSVDSLAFRDFYPRYIHFVEQSRGRTSTIHMRDFLDDLSRKAQRIRVLLLDDQDMDTSFSLLFRAHPDLQLRIRYLADAFAGLMMTADFHQQARMWSEQYRALHVFQQPARDAMWSTLYRTDDLGAFSRAIEKEQTSD